ncbi:MAG: hypothetical protein CMC90_01875 [Flavobacteriaceae bacterium]|nr:hypothetical protein [Flavobacteriaceae bacterium]|tara:strand:- start:1691 stop:3349 length:1659 start_codon:yes stop_codon:yes gene_type:complete
MNTKKSLYIYSNSSDLSLFFASSIIAPSGSSKGLKKAAYFEIEHSVQLFNSVNSDYASYFDKNREDNLVPVVLEINPTVLNSFYSIDEKKSLIKANSLEFYLLPFVPIYFVKNIHFASRDDLEHFNEIKFGNVNNSVIENKIISPNFFDGSHKKCKLIDINESPLIPISKTSSIDSLLGSIQILIYVAKNETSTAKTRQYLDFIKRFINREDLYELGERYSLDVLETFDKGISDIKEVDSLEVKVFKASLLKLSSEAFQDKTMDADFIEDIIDLIPGSILSKKEEEQIEQFLDLIEDISSGEFPLKDDFFTQEKRVTIWSSLILLMTQIGSREALDIIEMFKKERLREDIFIMSLMLFGLFRNYSSLDLFFKEADMSYLRNISLLSSPLLSDFQDELPVELIDKTSPDNISKWIELKVNNETVTNVSIDDPFYTSIVAQANEAGFSFKSDGDDIYVHKDLDKDLPDLFLIKGAKNNFRLKTEPVSKNLSKLKKENLIQILQTASDFDFRSSVIVEKNMLFLKRDQLSSTLDIEEMQLMVNDLKENFKTLKDL